MKLRIFKKRFNMWLILAGCFAAGIFFFSCSSTPEKEGPGVIATEPVVYPEPEVRLSTGDVIEIRFFYTPELNTTQAIRPDGKITLQLIGEVTALGKTPVELQEDMYNKYKTFLSQLDIAVIVQTMSNRRVYIGGEVGSPGSIPIEGQLTALEAIMLAGGVNLGTGKYDNVIIIRNQNGKWVGEVFNLEEAVKGAVSEPIYLKPMDIVYVPETRITEINRWLDQHIGTILPQIGFFYSINPETGDSSFGIDSTYTLGN
jgi:protein involved in polysaccharide export with SLBB domain